jgi:hypothetical protein
MFQPKTIRIFSIVAMVLSVLGLLLSLLFVTKAVLFFVMGIISWGLLFWASLIAFKLSSYKLYENEYKKVGICTYLIILAFILFLFVGLIIGFALSVILLSRLWGLKRNYDEWDHSDKMILVDEPANDMTNNPS